MTTQRLLFTGIRQGLYLADAAQPLDLPLIQQRHASGVVATVLEPAQPFQQNGSHRARRDGTDNSTHSQVPFFCGRTQ